MADPKLDYEIFLIENTFILTKYIYPEDFYDYLTSKHVLSSDDKELIDCRYSNPTRRQRACKLLEVLQKKGYEGFRHFMDYLEWEYSQIYEAITKKKARDPPPNYDPQPMEQRRRIKDLLLMDALSIMIADQLDKCVQKSHDLLTMDEITRVVKINQEDKKDLEKGMEDLRNKLEKLERGYADKSEELSNCMKEIDQLKNDKMVLYQNTIQLMSEHQNYREKWTQVQGEKDDLTKQLQDANEKLADMERNLQSCSELIASTPTLPAKPKTIKSQVVGRPIQEVKPQELSDRSSRIKLNSPSKLKILETDLPDARIEIENLIKELHNTRSDLEDKQRELRQTRKSTKKKCLNDARTQIERYYKNILTLGQEKMKLEVSRRNECKKYSEELEKYMEEISKTTEIFMLNHQLKAELDEFKEKYSKMELELKSLRDSDEWPQTDLSNPGKISWLNSVEPYSLSLILCEPCQCLLTVKHILVECVDFHPLRQKHFDVNNMKKLYDDVPTEIILGFIEGMRYI